MTDKILKEVEKYIDSCLSKVLNSHPFLQNPNEGKEPFYIDDFDRRVPGVNYHQHNPAPLKRNPKWTPENGSKLFGRFEDQPETMF